MLKPSPYFAIGFSEQIAMGKTGLDYSFYLGGYRTSKKILQYDREILGAGEWGLESAVGISKRIQMARNLAAIPFFNWGLSM